MASKKEKAIIDLDELISISNLKKDESSLPKGWEWISLEHLVDYERGITFPASAKKNVKEDGLIGCARTANIQSEFKWNDMIYIDKSYVKDESKLIKDNDILMSISNSYHLVGKVSFISNSLKPTTYGGFLMAIRAKNIESKYLFYYLRFLFNTGKIQKMSGQTTNIANLNTKKLNSIFVPVPNRDEQKRVVRKIEKLINKINQAQQLIEEAKETFELRRAAILENAFTGRLTRSFEQDEKYDKSSYLKKIKELKLEKYNELLNKSNEKQTKKPIKPKFFSGISESYLTENKPTNWLCTTLGSVIYDFKYGTSEKSDYKNQGQPVIRIPNIDEEYVSKDDIKFLSDNIYITEEIVENGDLLIIRSNGSRDLVGKCAVVDDKTSGYAYASYLIRMRPIGVASKFIYWLLKSNLVRRQLFSSSKSSAGINNINSQELASIVIPLPSYKEQKEIVSRIESLISKEKNILQLIHSEKRLDELKQSILSKAFKGELGTNDPDDEPAIEFLKSILQEKL
ncbi:hypothetical protein CN560_12280 [Bacillus wiedmannii]|uniref:restriction endonuclease subunit S n=1 Tax=Bacillus wiedmannii TaxID=1890302 RepID=UPI000BF1632B|nr:restriction endonuclease subunit S [Bacillus wiedmannii]PEO58312.1 hypothetical protein CN560_12280 [Bacillus wiedmannii]